MKHITSGEGGALITNNRELISKAYILRSHGMEKVSNSGNNSKIEPWYYEMNELGYNYRITDFQCALGSNQSFKIKSVFKKEKTHC